MDEEQNAVGGTTPQQQQTSPLQVGSAEAMLKSWTSGWGSGGAVCGPKIAYVSIKIGVGGLLKLFWSTPGFQLSQPFMLG